MTYSGMILTVEGNKDFFAAIKGDKETEEYSLVSDFTLYNDLITDVCNVSLTITSNPQSNTAQLKDYSIISWNGVDQTNWDVSDFKKLESIKWLRTIQCLDSERKLYEYGNSWRDEEKEIIELGETSLQLCLQPIEELEGEKYIVFWLKYTDGITEKYGPYPYSQYSVVR